MAHDHESIEYGLDEVKEVFNASVLTGTIVDVDTDNDKADVNISGLGLISAVPIFYHCEGESIVEGGAQAFEEGDNVYILNKEGKINPNVSDLKIVGFVDGLKECAVETVYVKMTVGATIRCFVWDVKGNEYAEIENDYGNSAVFPCDSADINDWYDKQESVGAHLFDPGYGMFDGDFKYQHPCGREFFTLYCPDGLYGTSGSNSDSEEEPSTCDSGFVNGGSCSKDWDLTNKCYYTDTSWGYYGNTNESELQHILWKGFLWEERPPKKIIFLNNKDGEDLIESALKMEALKNNVSGGMRVENTGGACPDRSNSGTENTVYKIHTPIAEDILEINYTGAHSMNIGGYSFNQTDYLVSARFNPRGSFSDKVIAQIYTVETRTVNREKIEYGGEWINQVYATNGLNLSAQVGVFEGDDYPDGAIGVDPTKLPCNNNFELAINTMYDDLRDAESVPEADVALIKLELLILKG